MTPPQTTQDPRVDDLLRRIQSLELQRLNPLFDVGVAGGAGILQQKIATNLVGCGSILLTGNKTLNDDIQTLNTRTGGTGAAAGGDLTGTYPNPTLASPVNLAGGQIKFPATQNPSANVNTLDDYEEGLWTPTVGGSTGSGTPSYAFQGGYYIKVGSLVTVWFEVNVNGWTGAPSGDFRIGGLPFTVLNATINFSGAVQLVGSISLSANYTQFGLAAMINSVSLGMFQMGSGQAVATISITLAGTTPRVGGMVTYQATA